MDDKKELEFLGTVLRLMSRYGYMTLAQIAHRTRAMRKPRRISADAIFPLMEKFAEGDLVRRTVQRSRVMYAAKNVDSIVQSTREVKNKREQPEYVSNEVQRDMLELGVKSSEELKEKIKQNALRYASSAHSESLKLAQEYRDKVRATQLSTKEREELLKEDARKQREAADAADAELLRAQQEDPGGAFR